MGSAGITSEKMKKTSLGPPIPAVFFNSSIKLTLILFWPLCVLSMEKWGVHWGVVQALCHLQRCKQGRSRGGRSWLNLTRQRMSATDMGPDNP